MMPDASTSPTNGKAPRAPSPAELVATVLESARAEGRPIPPGTPEHAARVLVAEARGETPPEPGAIDAAWSPVTLESLNTPPNARRWLLRYPTADGRQCAQGSGDGFFPRGKVGTLVSAGGVGKTHALVGLAISLATGRRWFDHFHVDYEARQGRVLLALAEEDAEEVHRRIYEGTRDLSPDELRRVAEHVVTLPLAGRPVSLLRHAADGRNIEESPELAALRARLEAEGGEHGWSLVALDPMARWAGPDVESDNTAATRLVQALETLTTAPGGPGVLVAHHSSKLARRSGSVDSRGVTGITDAVRWEATLRTDGKEVLFGLSKSNYSRPMFEDLRLVRGKGGALRAQDADEAEEHREAQKAKEGERDAAKEARREERIKRAEGAILAGLRSAQAPITRRSELASLASGTRTDVEIAIGRLLTQNTIAKVGEGRAARFELTGRGPS
jgi:hypothetical protein